MFGGIFIIAGSCIGAGMLTLPMFISLVGFFPGIMILFLICIYMLITALFLMKINFIFNKNGINFITISKHILGKIGVFIVWISFTFLFYCLLIAYVNKGGNLIKQFFELNFGINVFFLDNYF